MTDATVRGRRTLLVFVGLQMGQVMSSLDGTIVATALPSIVDDIGGLDRATWAAVGYTLAVVASMPLYGKLGDVHGRKRMFLWSVAIFLAASMACGLAQTMDQLLVARFVQGLGGGGLGTLAMATIADIVPARNLGRWLGYQGVVYAVASLLGPLAGGLFVDHLSWRWAFLINVPVGLIAAAIVATNLHLPVRRVRHRLDYPGAALLTSALVAFVLLATLGGHELAWRSPGAVGLAVAAVVLVVAFLRWERHAEEPVLPLTMLQDPLVRASVGINFTSGLLLWSGLFFVPLFLQEVLDISPTRSGLVLMPLMFGAAFGTLLTGKAVERTGRYRTWPIAGGALMTAGVALLATLDVDSGALLAGAFLLLLGTGVGFAMQPSLLATQNAVPADQLGSATSTALLFRIMGGTVGTPLLGGILNAGLDDPVSGAAFARGISHVYLAVIPVGLLAGFFALRLPERPLRERAHVAIAADATAG